MLAVYKRELRAYFSSPIGYIFSGFFLLIAGIFFTMTVLFAQSPEFTSVLSSVIFVFLLLVPILTMRLMSEDRSKKVDQLLLTSPLSLTGLVLGKYLAAITVFAGTIAVMGIYPIIMSGYGVINAPEIFGGFIGFFLLGCSFVAVGLYISSITESQVVAAIVTFGVLLGLWVIDGLAGALPTDSASGIIAMAIIVIGLGLMVYSTTKNIYAGIITVVVLGITVAILAVVTPQVFVGIMYKLLSQLSVLNQFSEFTMGIFSFGPAVYYISFSAVFVYLTVRTQEKRRWS
jgi:ABC-2 type transport system permease protein